MNSNYDITATPGPWFVVETIHQMNFEDTTVCTIKYVGQEKSFCVGSKSLHHGDAEATAKLIAAAPELLNALIELKRWVGKLSDWEGTDPPVEIVDAVILKATL